MHSLIPTEYLHALQASFHNHRILSFQCQPYLLTFAVLAILLGCALAIKVRQCQKLREKVEILEEVNTGLVEALDEVERLELLTELEDSEC